MAKAKLHILAESFYVRYGMMLLIDVCYKLKAFYFFYVYAISLFKNSINYISLKRKFY